VCTLRSETQLCLERRTIENGFRFLDDYFPLFYSLIRRMAARYDVAVQDYNRYLVASLEKCDSEKEVLVSKFEALAHDQDELRGIRDTVSRQSTEILKLQQDSSETRLMLQEEREKVARLMNENAVLSAQGDDDRSKIASLIRMRRNEMMQDDAAAQANKFPMRVSIMRPGTASNPKRGDPHAMSLRSVVTEYAGSNHVHVDVKSSPAEIDAIVHQPPPSSTLVSALSREIEGLKQQLDNQRRAYEHERAVRVCEERDRHQAQEETLRRYAATIDHLQALQNETTKEFVTFRHTSQISERGLQGELEKYRQAAEDARRALAKERSAQTTGIQMAIQNSDTRHHDVISSLRADIDERTSSFRREKDALMAQLSEFEEENRNLRAKVLKERIQKKRLIEQQKLENEGLHTEINLMKQHLRAVEKKIYFTQVRSNQQQQQQLQF
jgi:chromosome segregation ATPase